MQQSWTQLTIHLSRSEKKIQFLFSRHFFHFILNYGYYYEIGEYGKQGLLINDFERQKCNKITWFRAKIADSGCIQILNAVKHPRNGSDSVFLLLARLSNESL